MISLLKLFAVASLGAAFAASPAAACSTTTPCTVDGGEYFIALPEQAEGPVPALIFVHGYGSSGEAVFRNSAITSTFLDRGYAVIAPNGTEMQRRNGRSWSFHPERAQRRDEIAFLQTVRDDIIARHNIDPDKILLSGFSIGGSMVSYLACQVPDSFAAYAPVGGSFWRPLPTDCAGPVRVLHTHGWRDRTVPLEGRVIGGGDYRDPGAFVQGDVFQAMEIWRQTNDCVHLRADRFVTDGAFWRRSWDRCAPGSALEFVLHPGGHSVPRGWADMAIDWFEGL